MEWKLRVIVIEIQSRSHRSASNASWLEEDYNALLHELRLSASNRSHIELTVGSVVVQTDGPDARFDQSSGLKPGPAFVEG